MYPHHYNLMCFTPSPCTRKQQLKSTILGELILTCSGFFKIRSVCYHNKSQVESMPPASKSSCNSLHKVDRRQRYKQQRSTIYKTCCQYRAAKGIISYYFIAFSTVKIFIRNYWSLLWHFHSILLGKT